MSPIAAALLAVRRVGDNVLLTGEHNAIRFAKALRDAGVEVGVSSYPGCIVVELNDCGNTFYMWTKAEDIELLAKIWGADLGEKLTLARAQEMNKVADKLYDAYDNMDVETPDDSGD